jgi:hypothetical protein
MLLRVLLLLVLVILLVRFLVRLGGLAAAALREGAAPPVRPQAPAVALVPCRRCGAFVPRALVSSAPGDGFLCRSCAAA